MIMQCVQTGMDLELALDVESICIVGGQLIDGEDGGGGWIASQALQIILG
jgi:hypothetical protein